MIEVLVVDPNKVYAGMIKTILMEQLKDASVDVAGNIHELKRRLSQSNYDLVLADLSISMDGDEMKDILQGEVAPGSIIFWSTLERKEGMIEKPSTRFELKDAINSVLQDTHEIRINLEETQLMIRP